MSLHIAFSLGATKLLGAEVTASDRLLRDGRTVWCALPSCHNVRGLADLVAEKVRDIAKGRFVDLLGLAVKGPVSFSEGKAVVGPWKLPPFQKAEPFQKMVEEALKRHLVQYRRFVVLVDSESALRGESHRLGGLAGLVSGTVVIWGTGRGVKMREIGVVLQDIGKDEQGEDRWRVYSSIGRIIICVSTPPNPLRYEHRAIEQGHDPLAALPEGKVYYSERSAGVWLAAGIAEAIRALPQHESDALLLAMGAGKADLQFSPANRNPEAEKRVLAGITAAALQGNEWARSRLVFIGVEEGTALAAFAWAFRDLEAVQNIVLVSTIAERLGRDVGPGDLLLDNIRAAMRVSLIQRGMDPHMAERIANGVRRSQLGEERELLPFAPGAELA